MMCVEIQGVEMLTLIGGWCCVDFMNSIGVIAGVGRQRLAISTGLNKVVSALRQRKNPVFGTSHF
jgi:hypothetical protein